MKNGFVKPVAIILVILFCAAATITGFAVSAATHSNVAYDPAAGNERIDEGSIPALRDGVWQAVYDDDSSMLFFIEDKDHSFSLINPDKGIGLPSTYAYNDKIGMYKLQIAYAGNETYWRVIDNSGATATVKDENSKLITLHYLSDETFESFKFYSYDELCEMAKAQYAVEHDGTDQPNMDAKLNTDGKGLVAITAELDGEQVASFTVDIRTGIGVDDLGETVDLSVFAAQA